MKKINVLLFSGTLLAFAACADSFTPKSETFESATVNAAVADWDGDGYGKSETISSYPAGRPGGLTGESAKVLAIEGSVTNASLFTDMAESTSAQVDMMVKIVYPDETLVLPSNESGVQIAIGVDTQGRFNVYCAPKSGTGDAAFVPVSAVIANGTWVRVSFNFDYVNGYCQVSLDGLPLVSEYGVLSPTSTGSNGAWYKLVATAAKLTSMKVVGTTSIDDVYTSQVTSGDTIVIPDSVVVADTETGANVKKSWLMKQGVSNVSAPAPDNSGMTVAQKYLAGLDVTDGIKFELKDLQPSARDSTVMVFSFPGTTATGSSFSILGSDTVNGTYSAVDGTFTAGANGANNTVAINVSSLTGVKYFKLQAAQAAQ